MKKMNKMYEAPVAEVIDMQSVVVLAGSSSASTETPNQMIEDEEEP
jgi:hypothetical protein